VIKPLQRHARLAAFLAALALLFILISLGISRHVVPAGLSGPEAALFYLLSPLQRAAASASSAFTLLGTRSRLEELQREKRELLADRLLHLEAQNALLREEAAAAGHLARLLEYRISVPWRSTVHRVIGFDPGGVTRLLTIQGGAEEGIRPEMPVLGGEGVVGRTIRVTGRTAQVLPLVDINSAVDAVVQRTRDKGVLVGLGGRRCAMKYVERQAMVEEGDLVVTSGLGAFPPGLILGDVERVNREGDGLFQEIVVLPRLVLERLEHVAVVREYQP
jgi:rod shape-determining protein MreC